MKKQSFLLTILIIAFCNAVQAQASQVSFTKTLLSSTGHASKVLLTNEVSAAFHHNYPTAKDVGWAETENGYLASFLFDNGHYSVFLDKKGKTTSQIRYGTQKDLPEAISQRVRTAYDCNELGLVREVTTDGKMAYLITIDEKDSWKVIRVAGEYMEVWEEHVKG
jgi:hypothetical protein